MENEPLAPEDAGYTPVEEDFDDEFIEMITTMSSVIHKIFGDKVSFHIIVED